MSDRFQVRELEGFPINLPIRRTGSSPHYRPWLQTLVLDTAYVWRVVAQWDTATHGRERVSREDRYAAARAAADAEAARLNAEHDAWAAA